MGMVNDFSSRKTTQTRMTVMAKKDRIGDRDEVPHPHVQLYQGQEEKNMTRYQISSQHLIAKVKYQLKIIQKRL